MPQGIHYTERFPFYEQIQQKYTETINYPFKYPNIITQNTQKQLIIRLNIK